MVFDVFKHWVALVETQTGCKLKCLRTDNGGEFMSHAFTTLCAEKGIRRELSAPYTPPQNGVAERMNRTIREKVRSMLSMAGLSDAFWTEAVMIAALVAYKSSPPLASYEPSLVTYKSPPPPTSYYKPSPSYKCPPPPAYIVDPSPIYKSPPPPTYAHPSPTYSSPPPIVYDPPYTSPHSPPPPSYYLGKQKSIHILYTAKGF
ncbi:hypothetical protein L7F22_027145 [Adiantum nelumboides]|nr:hypothetical protein [Adiantum nelumboides]